MGQLDERSFIFHKTMLALEHSLTASLIGSDIDLEVGVFDLSSSDARLIEWACDTKRGFSRVPLRSSRAGRASFDVVAHIDVRDGRVENRRELLVEDVLAGSTNIGDLIQSLAAKPFYFLLNGVRLGQIVTVSDLNRLPVRIYLFTLLSHLEGMLADLITDKPDDSAWLGCLSPKQKSDIQNLFDTKRGVDIDTKLIDCTTLTHKFTVIAKHEGLRARFKCAARKDFDRHVRPILELRNRLSHGMDPIEQLRDEHELVAGEQLEPVRDGVVHGGNFPVKWDAGYLARVSDCIRKLIDAVVGEEMAA